MADDQLFQFLTKKDEYHSFLEKIYLRGLKLYDSAEQSIKESLINDYVEMERACIKEDFPRASFHYIKQLETIVGFGLPHLIDKINLDIKQNINNKFELTDLGKKIFGYEKRKPRIIEEILKNKNINLIDIQWTEKLSLFDNYFDISPKYDWNINELTYYKRNQHGHSNTNVSPDKEQKFQILFPTVFDFLIKTRTQLTKYINALKIPKNR